MNIDELKWCCEKAGNSWRIVEHPLHTIWFLRFNDGYTNIQDFDIKTIRKDNPVYRDLLQSAIEGVNRDAKKIYSPTIEIHEAAISARANNVLRFFRWGSASIAQAKEAALMYVREQEIRKGEK